MLIKNNNYQLFYINSYNRTSGTNSNFSFKLLLDPTRNFNKVIVLQASIPKTFYLISEPNNTFILNENGTNIIITIPVGNYTKTSFRQLLTQILNSSSLNGWTYSITENNILIQADTGKYIFSVSGNGTSQPIIQFANNNNNCYEQLGFDSNSTNTFISSSLISTNVVNFSLESTLFIRSNICQNSTSDNILQEIFTTGVPYNSFINYTCLQPELYSKNFVGKSDTYTFYLTNENGIEIDTNGININFTICIYESNDIDKEVLNFMDIQKMANYLQHVKE